MSWASKPSTIASAPVKVGIGRSAASCHGQRADDPEQSAQDEQDIAQEGDAGARSALVRRIDIAGGVDDPAEDEHDADHGGPQRTRIPGEQQDGWDEDDEVL